MGAIVHPTQRRFSCDTCRKHKSRCRRLYPNDTKCARCTLLDVECTIGEQRKVGRPRRVAASGDDATTLNASIDDPPAARVEEVMLSQAAAHLETINELSWSSIFAPATTPVPILDTTSDYGFSAETRPIIGMRSPDLFLQTPSKGALFWDAAHYPVETCSSSTTTTKSTFGITTPPTHSFHTPVAEVTASSPSDSIGPRGDALMLPGPTQPAVNGIAAAEAIANLSKINLNLHVRVAAAEANRAGLTFNGIIYKESPLCIDNFTLAEFLLDESQEFLLILMRLRANLPTRGLLCAPQPPQPTRSTTWYPELLPMSSQIDVFAQDHPSRPSDSSQLPASQYRSRQGSSQYNSPSAPTSYPVAASQPLLAPVALLITSIFIQFIYLHELTLMHLTARLERIDTDPIAPIPGLTFGGLLPLAESCTQGMLFSAAVVHLQERIERALGIGVVPEGGEAGLLSVRQMEVLWSELDEPGGIHGRGMMRPANVRESFDNVGKMFKQLSLR